MGNLHQKLIILVHNTLELSDQSLKSQKLNYVCITFHYYIVLCFAALANSFVFCRTFSFFCHLPYAIQKVLSVCLNPCEYGIIRSFVDEWLFLCYCMQICFLHANNTCQNENTVYHTDSLFPPWLHKFGYGYNISTQYCKQSSVHCWLMILYK